MSRKSVTPKHILNPLEIGNYGISEAAFYLQIPTSTLRGWLADLDLPTEGLSHLNLVEAYVLDAIRKGYGISLHKVRAAIDYVKTYLNESHPLAKQIFKTDGLNLFVEHAGSLIDVSSKGKRGQLALKEILSPYLERIEYDSKGWPTKLYPFTRAEKAATDPRTVEIRPGISGGRPVLVGTRIPVEELHGRFNAGESLVSIAEDMELGTEKVEEAIRFWSNLSGRSRAA